MLSRRDTGGVARPGRGEVDLEALQDAFFRDNLQPSAKVTRSKVSFIHLITCCKTAGDGAMCCARIYKCVVVGPCDVIGDDTMGVVTTTSYCIVSAFTVSLMFVANPCTVTVS